MKKRQIKVLFSHYTLAPLLGLFVAAWLISGLVMLYIPFPKLNTAEIAAYSQPIISEELEDFIPETQGIQSLIITKQLGRVSSNKNPEPVDVEEQDKRIKKFFGKNDVAYLGEFHNDQWTVHSRYNKHRPLLAWQIQDEKERVIYVSSMNGNIVQDTTKKERIWNYAGAILHWIYLTPLREKRDLWVSALNILTLATLWMTTLGLIRGWKLIRIKSRYRKAKRSPFSNSLKYHHGLGVGFGFLILTWLFTGFLSMNPFGFMNNPQITDTEIVAQTGGEWTAHRRTQLQQLIEKNRETINNLEPWKATFLLSQGVPIVELFSKAGRTIIAEEAFSATKSVLAIRNLNSDHQAQVDYINDYDMYYKGKNLPLPVLRLKIGDRPNTWYEVDARTGTIVRKSHRVSRLDRLLFRGLHTFDFGQSEKWEWLRKLGIILVSLFAIVFVGAGFYSFALKILKRKAKYLLRPYKTQA